MYTRRGVVGAPLASAATSGAPSGPENDTSGATLADAEPTPEVALRDVQPSRLTGTSLVRFDQVRSSIPIFGSHMVVEVDARGALVGVQADVAAVQGTSPIPTITPEAALASIAALAGADAAALQDPIAPTLTFFYDDDDDADRWPGTNLPGSRRTVEPTASLGAPVAALWGCLDQRPTWC